MRVLLIGILLAIAVGLIVAFWTREAPPVAPAAGPKETASASVTDEAPTAVAAAGSERSEVETPAPAPVEAEQQDEEPFDPSPVVVPRWLARFRVVDPDEQPIEGAKITIWAGKKVPISLPMRRFNPEAKHAYSGHEEEPLLELYSDAEGRAGTMLELECCYAAAEKEGLGRAGEVSLWHTRSAQAETKFVLDTPITLRGIVLREDGTPAAGATIRPRATGFSSLQRGRAPDPEPVVADAEGRFSFPVQRHTGYAVRAELDGKRSFSETAWVRSDNPPEVVLRFPGAITLGGLVVDPDGNPVPEASVRTWREFRLGEQDPDDDERAWAETGADGRFSIAVRRNARYQLLASAEGHAPSALTWVETTAVRPHTDVRLELLRFSTIAGVVRHGDGSPFSGARVGARPESGLHPSIVSVPTQRDQFPSPTPALTAEDGRFELAVHPLTTWTVVAVPVVENRWLDVRAEGIAPGTEDLVLEVTAADLAGCVVQGTVVRAADGRPVEGFEVELVRFDEDGKPRSSSRSGATIEGNRFVLPTLALDRTFAVRIQAPRTQRDADWAPAQSEPFVTTPEGITWDARVAAWGKLPVRVVEADGSPARRTRVMAQPERSVGLWPSAMPVDADGRVVLKRCVPGPHEVKVWRETEQLHTQELMITPGLNPEVLVRLKDRGR